MCAEESVIVFRLFFRVDDRPYRISKVAPACAYVAVGSMAESRYADRRNQRNGLALNLFRLWLLLLGNQHH